MNRRSCPVDSFDVTVLLINPSLDGTTGLSSIPFLCAPDAFGGGVMETGDISRCKTNNGDCVCLFAEQAFP
jgi:hypothetical protein